MHMGQRMFHVSFSSAPYTPNKNRGTKCRNARVERPTMKASQPEQPKKFYGQSSLAVNTTPAPFFRTRTAPVYSLSHALVSLVLLTLIPHFQGPSNVPIPTHHRRSDSSRRLGGVFEFRRCPRGPPHRLQRPHRGRPRPRLRRPSPVRHRRPRRTHGAMPTGSARARSFVEIDQ